MRHVGKTTLVRLVIIGRRISERMKDHENRDLKSHILNNSVDFGHADVSSFDF